MNNTSISMGKPITAPCLIPVLHSATPNCICEPFMANGQPYKITALSFGTPHGAVFVDDVDSVDVPRVGSALGNSARFPQGASIVFVQALDRETLKARLWQRGEGETASTSEAASVAAVSAMMLQKIYRSEAKVAMGGSEYRVNWDRAAGDVRLAAA